MSLEPSYYALRVAQRADGNAWWSEARGRRDAPRAIVALLAGRTRVELDEREADYALAWARSLDGWPGEQPEPLFVYTSEP
jgi:hypothetical protein